MSGRRVQVHGGTVHARGLLKAPMARWAVVGAAPLRRALGLFLPSARLACHLRMPVFCAPPAFARRVSFMPSWCCTLPCPHKGGWRPWRSASATRPACLVASPPTMSWSTRTGRETASCRMRSVCAHEVSLCACSRVWGPCGCMGTGQGISEGQGGLLSGCSGWLASVSSIEG